MFIQMYIHVTKVGEHHSLLKQQMHNLLFAFLPFADGLDSNFAHQRWTRNRCSCLFSAFDSSVSSSGILVGNNDRSRFVMFFERFSGLDAYFTKYLIACSSSKTICRSQLANQLFRCILQCWLRRGSLRLLTNDARTPPPSDSSKTIDETACRLTGKPNRQ